MKGRWNKEETERKTGKKLEKEKYEKYRKADERKRKWNLYEWNKKERRAAMKGLMATTILSRLTSDKDWYIFYVKTSSIKSKQV